MTKKASKPLRKLSLKKTTIKDLDAGRGAGDVKGGGTPATPGSRGSYTSIGSQGTSYGSAGTGGSYGHTRACGG